MYFRTDFGAARVNFVTAVHIFFTLFMLLCCFTLQAQEEIPDTVRQEDVVVTGFETNRTLLSTAAPVFSFSAKEIGKQVFPGATFAPLLNRVPGVRMEERSPGSYRLSIRGSLLRSPFGVRNIKVYFAGIPFTDAGGNTYINMLDVNMMRDMEILKGPSGITYGAGTGGTLLLNNAFSSRVTDKQDISASVTAGSYGSFGEYLAYRKSSATGDLTVQQSHTQSDGYRDHSFFRRDAALFNLAITDNKINHWNFVLLYGNLHYETPGGITFEQVMANPKLSRQRAGSIPSAIEQQAGIYQQTIFTGLSNKHWFSERWAAKTSVFYAYTDFANPFITNYETRMENSTGVRSVFTYTHGVRFRLDAGAEAAITGSRVSNYGNRGGERDTAQNKDRVKAGQAFAFVQAQWNITPSLIADAGVSANHFSYTYERLYPVTGKGKRSFELQLLPRISLLYRLGKSVSVYSSISRGYSPPTIAEVRPDNQVLNTSLQPEAGTNIEAGLRGNLLPVMKQQLYVDISVYQFRLNHTIVRRTDAAGDFFVNAGNTKQEGIEWLAHAVLARNRTIEEFKIFTSVTLNNYRFKAYKIGNTVYDGNKITGVPGKIYVLGADLQLTKGWYINAMATYTSSIPLTDDNLVTAKSFYLLNGRTGYRFIKKKWNLEIFLAGNNLLNELYSPGNDLNALGRRYYNPGAKRNFTGGVMLRL